MENSTLDRIPHDCALKLQAVYGTLKTAERKAADFLLANPGEVHVLTIVDYASRAGCSEATIVRLSKRLGYEGFPELKAAFAAFGEAGRAAAEADPSVLDYQGLSAGDDPVQTMRTVFDSSARAIADTANTMDAGAYRRALDALCSAGAVMFSGVGDAAVVAQEAYLRWLRIGFPAYFSVDYDIQLILASKLKKGDVLLAVSHSGQTRSQLAVVREAEKAGATVVAITNFPLSPLAKRASCVLQTAVFTTYVSGEVMAKRLAELCVVESLFVNFMIRKGEPYLSSLVSSNEVVNQNKL